MKKGELMKCNKKTEQIPYGSSPDGFIPSMAMVKYLKDKHRILIVGDFSKRDYAILSALGKEVHVIDIVPIEGVKHFYLQSITNKTPFEEKYFDGIVLAEVIEHLFEDYIALQEIHRILKDDGSLVITVPYFSNVQDKPEYHVRIHSSKTITRLLQHSGFTIEEHFYRGLMSRFSQKNKLTKYALFGFRKFLVKIWGEKGSNLFRQWCFRLECFLGSKPMLIPIQKRCTSFGGIMKVSKGTKTNFMNIQVNAFSPSASTSTKEHNI